MWWMFACSVGSSILDTPIAFEGDGVHALVTSTQGWTENETRVDLWSEGFATQGSALADLTEDPDGSIWLHFAVQTGLGEAVAAMRIEGNSALIPLGVRPGEYELLLRKSAIDSQRFSRLKEDNKAGMAAKRQAWQDGVFLLKEDHGTVGELRFRGDQPPLVGVYDQWWLTPRPVEASVRSEGAEIVLGFDVEPSFQGEGGLLRISVPLWKAIAPMGPVPVSEERAFTVVAGALSEEERNGLIAFARSEADAIEEALIQKQAKRLAGEADKGDGTCRTWADMAPAWEIMFMGYEIDIVESDRGCTVEIEPVRAQHGRRFRGRVTR